MKSLSLRKLPLLGGFLVILKILNCNFASSPPSLNQWNLSATSIPRLSIGLSPAYFIQLNILSLRSVPGIMGLLGLVQYSLIIALIIIDF